MKSLYCTLSVMAALSLSAADHPELKAYPPAADGQVRHVIVVPYMAEENDYKVEVFVGKIIITDATNQKMMGGTFEEKTLEGWGYPYYVAKTGAVASTLMMPLPGQENVERFVAMPGKLIRYNSRLPIVIYTEPEAVVRYRIWSAGETITL